MFIFLTKKSKISIFLPNFSQVFEGLKLYENRFYCKNQGKIIVSWSKIWAILEKSKSKLLKYVYYNTEIIEGELFTLKIFTKNIEIFVLLGKKWAFLPYFESWDTYKRMKVFWYQILTQVSEIWQQSPILIIFRCLILYFLRLL